MSAWKHHYPPSPLNILYSLLTHPSDCLQHQLILDLHSEVAYLLLLTLPTSLCRHLKISMASICETSQISRTSIHSWGILPGSEKASLSVYEILMRIASAVLCAWEHTGPSPCCKAHLLCVLACVKQKGLPKSSSFNLNLDFWDMKRTELCRWAEAVGQRNHSDWLFSLANQCMRSKTEVRDPNKLLRRQIWDFI